MKEVVVTSTLKSEFMIEVYLYSLCCYRFCSTKVLLAASVFNFSSDTSGGQDGCNGMAS